MEYILRNFNIQIYISIDYDNNKWYKEMNGLFLKFRKLNIT